jgi:ABC-type phosphate transport system auxiliary subunit
MSYLSLTEHRGLLNNLVDAYQPVNDLSVINGVVEKLRNTEQLRTQQRNDTHQQLKTLTRQLDTVKLHAQRPEGTDSEEQHAQRMVELDREKFSLAKAIQTEEQEQRYPFYVDEMILQVKQLCFDPFLSRYIARRAITAA